MMVSEMPHNLKEVSTLPLLASEMPHNLKEVSTLPLMVSEMPHNLKKVSTLPLLVSEMPHNLKEVSTLPLLVSEMPHNLKELSTLPLLVSEMPYNLKELSTLPLIKQLQLDPEIWMQVRQVSNLTLLPIKRHCKRLLPLYMLYADNQQLYIAFYPGEEGSLNHVKIRMEIKSQIIKYWLMLTDDKTEVLLFSSRYHEMLTLVFEW